jgi:uncharacterized damage-inducible protein DinB
MKLTGQLAKHFRELYFGGNWTSVNMKDSLADVDWKQATTQLHSLNTIAALVFHTNYYVSAILNVLQGEPLQANDQFSFDLPPVQSNDDWQQLLDKSWGDAQSFASMVEQLPEARLDETFADEKYGSYYRNLQGVIEHTHYHLGQIVILKKLLAAKNNNEVSDSRESS